MTPSALRATTKLPAVVRNLLARVMDLGWLWVLPGPFHHHSGANLSTSPKWVFPLGSNSPKRAKRACCRREGISVAVTHGASPHALLASAAITALGVAAVLPSPALANSHVKKSLNSADTMFNAGMDGCPSVRIAALAASPPDVYGPTDSSLKAEVSRYANRCGLRF